MKTAAPPFRKASAASEFQVEDIKFWFGLFLLNPQGVFPSWWWTVVAWWLVIGGALDILGHTAQWAISRWAPDDTSTETDPSS